MLMHLEAEKYNASIANIMQLCNTILKTNAWF